MPHDDFELVTIRLRAGDRDALKNYFHPLKYNAVIRGLVSRMVDKIRSDGEAKVKINDHTINLEEDL